MRSTPLQRLGSWLFFCLILGAFAAWPGLSLAVEEISIDDSGAAPASVAAPATASAPQQAVPTAPPPPAPPTPTPVPPPPPPVPTSVPAKPTPVPQPAVRTPTAAPETQVEEEPEETPVPSGESGSDQEMRKLAEDLEQNSEVELTFYGQYSRAFQNLRDNGAGGMVRIEYRFPRLFSCGIDFGTSDYLGSSTLTGALDMMLRFIPIRDGDTEYYLIGGGGLSTFPSANPYLYPGPSHVFGGVGGRFPFDENWGVDLNVVYDRYSPDTLPLGSVTAQIGLSYIAGD